METINLYGNKNGVFIYLDDKGLIIVPGSMDVSAAFVKVIGHSEYRCSKWASYQNIRLECLKRFPNFPDLSTEKLLSDSI